MSDTPRRWLLISEEFRTVQGEGPSAGTPAFFVRLGACDQHCKWCDTPYTWAFGEKALHHESKSAYQADIELSRVPIEEIAMHVNVARVPLCVVTGGEPMLQHLQVDQLISQVNEYTPGVRFEIETAGTHAPGELDIYPNLTFNVSPKLSSSGNDIRIRYKPDVLRDLAAFPRTIFKFVPDTRHGYSEEAKFDILEVEKIVRECGILPRQVYLMPCGITEPDLNRGLEFLTPIAIDHGWNVTDRLHIRIWGNKRAH